jgi:hypothetical protein
MEHNELHKTLRRKNRRKRFFQGGLRLEKNQRAAEHQEKIPKGKSEESGIFPMRIRPVRIANFYRSFGLITQMYSVSGMSAKSGSNGAEKKGGISPSFSITLACVSISQRILHHFLSAMLAPDSLIDSFTTHCAAASSRCESSSYAAAGGAGKLAFSRDGWSRLRLQKVGPHERVSHRMAIAVRNM